MLETLVSKFLTKYLRQYFAKLDKSQLSMAIWKGDVQFSNLQILPNALSQHGIPLTINQGTIGLIKMVFPWKKLKKEAVIIDISNILIFAKVDGNTLLEKDLKTSTTSIKLVKPTEPSKEDQKMTWQSILNTIIDNLSVSIKNLSIRIDVELNGSTVSFGLTFPSFSLNTVDENDNLLGLVQHPDLLIKKLMLEKFSFYMDINGTQVDMTHFQDSMIDHIFKIEHQYIIKPFTLSAHLKYNRQMSNEYQSQIYIDISDIQFNFDLKQGHTLLQLKQRFLQFSRKRKFVQCIRPKILDHLPDLMIELPSKTIPLSLSFELPSKKLMDSNSQLLKPKGLKTNTDESDSESFESLNNSSPNLLQQGDDITQLWNFAFRCAQLKRMPHIFKPELALAILKNRVNYLNISKQIHKLPVAKKVVAPKIALKKIEKIVGPEASLFLHEYSKAIIEVDSNLDGDEQVSRTDLFDIKGLDESKELFLSFKSISFSLLIQNLSFQFEALKKPLFTLSLCDLNGDLKNFGQNTIGQMQINTVQLKSFFNSQIRSLFQSQSPFMHIKLNLNEDIHNKSVEVTIKPFVLSVEEALIIQIFEFFDVQMSFIQKEFITKHINISDQIQSLYPLRNTSLKLFIESATISLFVPYQNKLSQLTLNLSNFIIKKKCPEYYSINAPKTKFCFIITFQIPYISYGTTKILDLKKSKIDTTLILHRPNDLVELLIDLKMGSFSFYVSPDILTFIVATIQNFVNQPTLLHFLTSKRTKTIFAFSKISFMLSSLIPTIDLVLYDGSYESSDIQLQSITNQNENIESYQNEGDQNLSSQIFASIDKLKFKTSIYQKKTNFDLKLEKIDVKLLSRTILLFEKKRHHTINAHLSQSDSNDILLLTINIMNPYINLDVDLLIPMIQFIRNLISEIEISQIKPNFMNTKAIKTNVCVSSALVHIPDKTNPNAFSKIAISSPSISIDSTSLTHYKITVDNLLINHNKLEVISLPYIIMPFDISLSPKLEISLGLELSDIKVNFSANLLFAIAMMTSPLLLLMRGPNSNKNDGTLIFNLNISISNAYIKIILNEKQIGELISSGIRISVRSDAFLVHVDFDLKKVEGTQIDSETHQELPLINVQDTHFDYEMHDWEKFINIRCPPIEVSIADDLIKFILQFKNMPHPECEVPPVNLNIQNEQSQFVFYNKMLPFLIGRISSILLKGRFLPPLEMTLNFSFEQFLLESSTEYELKLMSINSCSSISFQDNVLTGNLSPISFNFNLPFLMSSLDVVSNLIPLLSESLNNNENQILSPSIFSTDDSSVSSSFSMNSTKLNDFLCPIKLPESPFNDLPLNFSLPIKKKLISKSKSGFHSIPSKSTFQKAQDYTSFVSKSQNVPSLIIHKRAQSRAVELKSNELTNLKIQNESEKYIEKVLEKDIEKDIERDIENDIEKDIERDIEKDIEKDVEKENQIEHILSSSNFESLDSFDKLNDEDSNNEVEEPLLPSIYPSKAHHQIPFPNIDIRIQSLDLQFESPISHSGIHFLISDMNAAFNSNQTLAAISIPEIKILASSSLSKLQLVFQIQSLSSILNFSKDSNDDFSNILNSVKDQNISNVDYVRSLPKIKTILTRPNFINVFLNVTLVEFFYSNIFAASLISTLINPLLSIDISNLVKNMNFDIKVKKLNDEFKIEKNNINSNFLVDLGKLKIHIEKPEIEFNEISINSSNFSQIYFSLKSIDIFSNSDSESLLNYAREKTFCNIEIKSKKIDIILIPFSFNLDWNFVNELLTNIIASPFLTLTNLPDKFKSHNSTKQNMSSITHIDPEANLHIVNIYQKNSDANRASGDEKNTNIVSNIDIYSNSANIDNSSNIDFNSNSDYQFNKYNKNIIEKEDINLNCIIPEVQIFIPSNMKPSKTDPTFKISLKGLIKMIERKFSFQIENYSLGYVYKQLFSPIVSVSSTNSFFIEIGEKKSISIGIEMAATTFSCSYDDIISTIQIATIIQKIINELRCGVVPDKINSLQMTDKPTNASLISSLDLSIGQLTFAFSKEKRNSNLIIPFLRAIFPPIKINNIDLHEGNSFSISFRPYIEFFNNISGSWNMIVEPFTVECGGYFTEDNIRINVEIPSALNVYIELAMIQQLVPILSSLNEVITLSKAGKPYLKKNEKYTQMPLYWTTNNYCEECIIKIKEKSYTLEKGVTLPFFDISNSDTIDIYICDSFSTHLSFKPESIIFPTFFDSDFSIRKAPYKGGVMFIFYSPLRLKNCIDIPLELYINSKNNHYVKFATLYPKESISLHFKAESTNNSCNYILMQKDDQNKSSYHHQPITISPSDNSTTIITIYINGSPTKIIKSIKYNNEKCCRTISLHSLYSAFNHLSFPISIKTQQEEIIVQPSQSSNLYMIKDDRILTASFSLDSNLFGPSVNIKINSGSILKIPAGSDSSIVSSGGIQNIYIKFDQGSLPNQLYLTFFVPFTIFNVFSPNDKSSFVFFDEIQSSIEPNIDIQPNIDPGSVFMWTPNKNVYEVQKDHFNAHIIFKNSSNYSLKSISVDIGKIGRKTLFFPIPDQTIIFNPVCCITTQAKETRIITLAPYIQVENQLPFLIALQAIEKVPKQFTEKGYYPLHSEMGGSPIILEPNTSTNVNIASKSFAYILQVANYDTMPTVVIGDLRHPQKSVFRIYNKNTYFIIEMEIIDDGLTYHAVFRKASFPTPFVISNSLPISVFAFHTITKIPIECPPFSTVAYPLDEPTAFPCIHLIFGDSQVNLSLLDENSLSRIEISTEKVPVFVGIRFCSNGTKQIFVENDIPIPPPIKDIFLSLKIASFYVSIIDLHTKELLLLSMRSISTEIHQIPSQIIAIENLIKSKSIKNGINDRNHVIKRNPDETKRKALKDGAIIIKSSIGTIQIDDQIPQSGNPVILCGRWRPTDPFFAFNCAIPIDVPFGSVFNYMNICIQRIDIDLSDSFLSDIIQIIPEVFPMSLNECIISPAQPLFIYDSSKNNIPNSQLSRITFHWLEISPMFLSLKFRSGGRPAEKQIISYFRYVPSTNGKMIIPGLFLANVSESIMELSQKIVGDFASSLFEQALSIFGIPGIVLRSFGAAGLITHLLGFEKLQMSSNVNEFLKLQNYKNFKGEIQLANRERDGPFKKASIQFLFSKIKEFELGNSPIISSLMSGTDAGLKLRTLENGIYGIISKLTIEKMENIETMDGISRMRNPRPFISNHVGVFDQFLSKVNNTIQKDSFERLRVGFWNGSTANFVVITDNSIFVLDQKGFKIQASIRFLEILSIVNQGKIIMIRTIGKNIEIPCESEKLAYDTILFVNSRMKLEKLFCLIHSK